MVTLNVIVVSDYLNDTVDTRYTNITVDNRCIKITVDRGFHSVPLGLHKRRGWMPFRIQARFLCCEERRR